MLIVIIAVITAYGFVRGGSYNRALAKAGISDKLHWHETVYAGINALKKIETLSDVLPPNVTADIYSSDGSPYYWLHFVSFSEEEIAPESLLRQKRYIE